MKIQDGVFLVTGGASGLGAACVRHLTGLGARVLAADLNQAAGDALVQECAGLAHFCRTDVTLEESAQQAVAAALALGPLRGLVSCAGVAPGEKVVGKEGPHRLETFARTIQINLIGTFNVLRLAASAMTANDPDPQTGERGVIINTASVAAFEGQLGQAAYAASKGGVVAMTLPIARELARSGIRVMTIAPGIMETPMLMGMPESVQDSLNKMIPFPSRMGKPGEFAALVAHIITNPYLNGETIRLDGAIRMAAK